MIKIHRSFIILIVSLTIVFVSTACDRQDPTAEPGDATPAATEETTATVSPEPLTTEEPTETAEPVETPARFENLHVPSPDWSEQII